MGRGGGPGFTSYGRGAGRRRTPPSPPFRAWGLALAFWALMLVWIGAWTSAAVVGLLLVFYLLALRLTKCRVVTKRGTPCRWLVRGVLGTCDWHQGLKHGMPRLARVRGSVLPVFLWQRPDVVTSDAGEAPPAPARAVASRAARPMYDWAILALEGLGVLIAVLSFTYQLAAG